MLYVHEKIEHRDYNIIQFDVVLMISFLFVKRMIQLFDLSSQSNQRQGILHI